MTDPLTVDAPAAAAAPASDPLVAEGWRSPDRRGPSRVQAIAAALTAIVALGAVWLFLLRDTSSGVDDRSPSTVVEVNEVGRAAVVDESRDLPTEVRTDRGVDYLVVRTELDARADGGHRIDVRPPAGVDPERVTLRVAGSLDDVTIDTLPGIVRADVELGGADDDLDVVVTMPADLLALPADGRAPVGDLDEVTAPLDRRASRDADQIRSIDRLRDVAPWLLPVLALLGAGVPLLLWRRAARAFFSMRRPGPGTQLDAAPPSSLDPVGAAVLVAGARPPDAAGAFAGQVLDLVERRQLLARRTMDVEPGAGVLVGLGHAEEVTGDAAIDALRAIALADGVTSPLPDSPSKRRRVPEAERDAWHLHVAARARFEGMVDRIDTRRLAIAAGVLALAGLVALVLGAATDLAARRAASWLVTAATITPVLVLTLWIRDARRWRIVTRERRLERAQWLAWRAAIGRPDGPQLDQRSLPVLAATGTRLDGVRTFAGTDEVGLSAVSTKTIETLRAIIAD